MKRTLGTCYYPEHWPRAMWADDARRMVDAGLTWVRIGEFAWSQIEPRPGQLELEWLDEAIEILGSAGLRVVLGTPTATPPRWMLDRHPDMLAVDAQGRPRNFGSRRHYCFSHEGYKTECARIVGLLAERYGPNPHIAAWQTDNEYGCHGTSLSYSQAACNAFRTWLRARYPGDGNDGDIDALNRAWGNVFWSMDYGDFDQIDLPNLTVTEPNPAHSLDFRKFSSDQVVAFNKLQTQIIRRHSNAPITHNFMGKITDFNHFDVGGDLEFASWDSYPLGFLEDRASDDAAWQRQFMRQGDPDFQAFHHDLYRSVGHGRMWVMEQQPGPVNWAPYNPAPLPGMVKLWTWEAFAHGADAVCYFRWRQAPMAQEQMHAGIFRPDNEPAPAFKEICELKDEILAAEDVEPAPAKVALIFDYTADMAWSIQPHAHGLGYFDLVFNAYRSLRMLGQSIDILPPDTRDFDGYKFVAAPGLIHMTDELKGALTNCGSTVFLGPRTAARDGNFAIPVPLPPAIDGLDPVIDRVESLRPDMPVDLVAGGQLHRYREFVETTEEVIERSADGEPVLISSGNVRYLAAHLDTDALKRIFSIELERAGLEVIKLPDTVRIRDTQSERFWFNYGTQSAVVGSTVIPAATALRT